MPFIREGLCAADQVICAKMLDRGVSPKVVAKKLRTTEAVVKNFTTEKLNAWNAKKKGIEKKVIKQEAETRKTASALAGAAKNILNQRPADDETFE